MDYGKIAYYKTQELEQRASSSSAIKYDSLDIQLGRAPGERFELAEVLGNGLLIVRVISGGNARLFADNALIAAGGGGFTAAVPAGSCRLYLSSSDTVESVQITAVGSGVSLSSASAKLCAGREGTFIAALDSVGGVLTLYTSDGSGFTAAAALGESGDYDIAVSGGIYVAYNRPDGKTMIIKYTKSLSVESSCLLDLGAKYIAITAYNGGAALAYYAAGAVSVTLLTSRLTVYDSALAHTSPSVTGVAFAKGAETLTLVINDGYDCLIRVAE